MSITLELKPDVEARLVAQADRQGIPVSVYLEAVINNHLSGTEGNASSHEASDDEWEKTLLELTTSLAFAKAPSLSDEAISRESIYREREDAQL